MGSDKTHSIEFDPIAWCVEYTEYANITEAFLEHHGWYEEAIPKDQGNRTAEQQLEWFEDNTTVIKLDGGRVIVQDF